MTMHLNYPDEIVKGWKSGDPVKALCGFERVLVGGKPPTGELCTACEQAAKAQDKPIPERVLTSEEMRKKSRTQVWSYTYLGAQSFENFSA